MYRSIEEVDINYLKRDVNRLFLAEQEASLSNRVQATPEKIKTYITTNRMFEPFIHDSVESCAKGDVSNTHASRRFSGRLWRIRQSGKESKTMPTRPCRY